MNHVRRIALAAAFAIMVMGCGAAEDAAEVVDDAADAAGEAVDAAGDAADAAGDAVDAASDAAEEAVDEVTGGESVAVSLLEWSLEAPTSIAAGEVTFTAANDGEFPHEFAIVRGDSYETLPLLANGAVDEAALGADFLGRTDRIGSGTSADFTIDLEPGNYVLLCNIESGPNSHAAAGQVLSVTVEG